jgi:hypothetical protein
LNKPYLTGITVVSIEYYPVVPDYPSTSTEGIVYIISTAGWKSTDIETILNQVFLLGTSR